MCRIRRGIVLLYHVPGLRETKGLYQTWGRKERARVESAAIQDADSQLMLGRVLDLANGDLKSPEK